MRAVGFNQASIAAGWDPKASRRIALATSIGNHALPAPRKIDATVWKVCRCRVI
jgi:hypothetical protein